MKIREAKTVDYEIVRAFYHSLIDAMQTSEFAIGWEKDIYPSPEFLKDSIEQKELYIGIEAGKIVAAMVLNHQCNESYGEYQWPTAAAEEEVTVIHALGVHPAFSGRGYAKQCVAFALEKARAAAQKVVRLDVLKGNVPAERLYAGMGFEYQCTLPMFYEDTGWTDYELYEYRLLKDRSISG